jgi:uncharacterized peroxidase-related enzyme
MSEFPVHDPKSAPGPSRPILEEAEKSLGFVPNLYGMLAESPALLKGYTTLSSIFEGGTLSPTERQVVLLSTSYQNGCDYCMAAHTAIAGMQKVPESVVSALREGRPIEDPKLRALQSFTHRLVERRGWVPEGEVKGFLDAGYSTEHVLEVVLGVGLKTLSNYANHLAKTPLDSQFEPHRWTRAVHSE